jgi:hypothetical protein
MGPKLDSANKNKKFQKADKLLKQCLKYVFGHKLAVHINTLAIKWCKDGAVVASVILLNVIMLNVVALCDDQL